MSSFVCTRGFRTSGNNALKTINNFRGKLDGKTSHQHFSATGIFLQNSGLSVYGFGDLFDFSFLLLHDFLLFASVVLVSFC